MTWRSKKESVVSLSRVEAENRALRHAITELTWLRIPLSELGFGPKKPMVLFCYNKAAIEMQTIQYNGIGLSILSLIGTTSRTT